jgi:hypothetical protein
MKRVFKETGQKYKKQECGAILLADQAETAKKFMRVFCEIRTV